MAAGGLTQEEIEEYARQMESSNAYLLDLVNNVIDIADMDSQTDDMPKKQVNVDACCRECMEAVRQNLKDGIEPAICAFFRFGNIVYGRGLDKTGTSRLAEQRQ